MEADIFHDPFKRQYDDAADNQRDGNNFRRLHGGADGVVRDNANEQRRHKAEQDVARERDWTGLCL